MRLFALLLPQLFVDNVEFDDEEEEEDEDEEEEDEDEEEEEEEEEDDDDEDDEEEEDVVDVAPDTADLPDDNGSNGEELK